MTIIKLCNEGPEEKINTQNKVTSKSGINSLYKTNRPNVKKILCAVKGK